VVQEKEINDNKTEMLTEIRRDLNNYDIQLKIIINKNPDSVKPFTPEEKFKKMADKNPALKTLKDKFDLDMDY
jgi:DNA polymerase III subunit gamma/tau